MKCLKIREAVLGVKHVDTATSYNNIGSIYKLKDDYDNCLKYFNCALNIYKHLNQYLEIYDVTKKIENVEHLKLSKWYRIHLCNPFKYYQF